jgi:hypothetical protein
MRILATSCCPPPSPEGGASIIATITAANNALISRWAATAARFVVRYSSDRHASQVARRVGCVHHTCRDNRRPSRRNSPDHCEKPPGVCKNSHTARKGVMVWLRSSSETAVKALERPPRGADCLYTESSVNEPMKPMEQIYSLAHPSRHRRLGLVCVPTIYMGSPTSSAAHSP